MGTSRAAWRRMVGVWGQHESGFSLLEMAVCLAIIGYMVGFGLQVNAAQTERQCLATTQAQLEQIRSALEQFQNAQQRYPLPAARNGGTTDPDYGREVPGPLDTRIARVAGNGSAVLIGLLPVAALGIPTTGATDCWRAHFTYAITESLTTQAGYATPANLGSITVNRGTLAAPVLLTNRVSYVVISHGANALGATPQLTTGAARDCNSVQMDSAQPRIDKENCDTLNSVFFASDFNDGDMGLAFFDDVLAYAEKAPLPTLDCNAGLIQWGDGCEAPALITLAGLSVPLTNIASGYTGTAVSVCNNGVRTTILGVCLPIGFCSGTNPRSGNPMSLLTGLGMNFGTGVCKQYKCCHGNLTISNLSPCPLLDLPGLTLSCP